MAGDPPELRFGFSAQPAEDDEHSNNNQVGLIVITQRPGVQPSNQRFRAAELGEWSVDAGVRAGFGFSLGLRVFQTGRVHQTIDGLEPGRTYSLRARVTGDVEARATALVRAVDLSGRVLGSEGPADAGSPETLQTLFTAPEDGRIRIELLSEINEFAIVRGEIASVGWIQVELRDAAPQTILVPEHYARIQDAIDASSDGDVISVGPGLYRELLDLGDKALILENREGRDRTIIDGGRNGHVLAVGEEAPRTTVIRGLTFRNGSTGASVEGSAILEYCELTDNTVGVRAQGRLACASTRSALTELRSALPGPLRSRTTSSRRTVGSLEIHRHPGNGISVREEPGRRPFRLERRPQRKRRSRAERVRTD